jgi:predicted DNA-binding transcriptional regulator AlpA
MTPEAILANIRTAASAHPMSSPEELAEHAGATPDQVREAVKLGWARAVDPHGPGPIRIVRDNWMQDAMAAWFFSEAVVIEAMAGRPPSPEAMQVHARHLEGLRADPVGATEIAGRVGVERATVEQWTRRHADFPRPRWTVGGRPAWDWCDVVPWLASTGRDRGLVT